MIWSIHSMGNHWAARFPQNAGVLIVLVLLVWGVVLQYAQLNRCRFVIHVA